MTGRHRVGHVALVVGAMLLVGCSAAPAPTGTPGASPTVLVTPQPPSATPAAPLAPAGAPIVNALTPQQFAAALRGDELGGQTVIVDGAIVAGPPVPRPGCMPGVIDGHTCYLGELEGIEPAITISAPWYAVPEPEATTTFNEPRIEWPYWSFPGPPVRGLLVLHVRGGVVDYVGRALTATEALTRSVGEVRAMDPGSLAPDDLLLVDGWLTGIDTDLDCPAPPNGVTPGLPNRWCASSGWLMDDVNRSPYLEEDRAAGIELQDQAYYSLALAPSSLSGDVVPQAPRGVYALGRSLEGWCETRDAPCWYWRAAARVAPRASEADLPTRTLECGTLSAGDGRSGSQMSLIDETGLAEGCHASWSDPNQASGVVIENPLPNAATLAVTWPGRSCDTGIFTLRQSAAGYELVGQMTPGICDWDSEVRHDLMIGVSQPVPAESVHATVAGLDAVVPTPTPAPVPVIVPCTTTPEHATIYDQTGFVDSCSTIEPEVTVDDIAVLDFYGGGLSGLRVFWTGSMCDAAPIFRLRQSGMRYELTGELYGDPCGPADVPYEIELGLNTDLPASAIDVSLVRIASERPTPPISESAATQRFDLAEGTFEIGIAAGKATYSAGEPIEITGQITWLGPAGSTLQVFGGNSRDVRGLVHFGWEQLAGEQLKSSPVFRQSCTATTLVAGQPLAATFAKESGTFGDTKHDEFWDHYFATSELTLPPGRYRIQARALFEVGACEGTNDVGLWVYSVIDVTE